jgi:WD40 repeat protein
MNLIISWAVAFNKKGTQLATGDNHGFIYLWNLASHQAIGFSDPSTNGVDSVAFSPNGATLAVGDTNGKTYLWNIGTY